MDTEFNPNWRSYKNLQVDLEGKRVLSFANKEKNPTKNKVSYSHVYSLDVKIFSTIEGDAV
ncbi:MAG: hypothetical protein EU530_07380 [Promethearchaeota archaeon]|nr:MAG: hypothetical protein EU530_07380 [Candidatus Lokiarchaeota archaeon]